VYSTCFQQQSVHLQEGLYMQFYDILSFIMHFVVSYYIFIRQCQRNQTINIHHRLKV